MSQVATNLGEHFTSISKVESYYMNGTSILCYILTVRKYFPFSI